MQVNLYNFDHQLSSAGNIFIDKFRIEIDEEHCENIKLLKREATSRFTNAPNGDRIVEHVAAICGGYQITARVIYDEEDLLPSELYDETLGFSSLNDLCVTLSVLTGRLVFLECQLESRPSVNIISRMVSLSYFSRCNLSLKPLALIKNHGLSSAFLNLAYTSTSTEMLARGAFANSIINVLYDKWCRLNGHSKYPASEEINRLVRDFSGSLKLKLLAENVGNTIVQDIVARIHVDSGPSAIFKFTSFLQGIDLISSTVDTATSDRIRKINRTRNAFSHAGELPDLGMPHFHTAQIAATLFELLLTISQWYFASQYLNLNDFFVERDRRELQDFFSSGVFRGHELFSETFEEFSNRLEQSWIDDGEFNQ